MRKRTYVGLTGMVLLSGLILLGCPQPSGDPAPEKTLIIGEEGLIAKVEEGVNYLWWNSPEGLATGWGVYRRDTITETLANLSSTIATNGRWKTVVDAAGWDNQLIDGRVYEYNLYSGSEILDTVTLKAKVPAQEGFTIALAAGDIQVKRYQASSSGADMLLVTFPNQPNLRYEVKYTYGQNQTITREFGNFSISSTELADYWFAPQRAAAFPLLGGANTIAVKATFVNNDNANGNYYDKTEIVSKALEPYTAAPVLARPDAANFTITEASGLTRFEWDYDDPSVTEFEILKAEVNKSIGNLSNPSNISVIGNWTEVRLNGLGSTGSGPAQWSAHEVVTDHTKYYVYALFAKDGENRSPPAYAQVSASLTVPGLTSFTAAVLSPAGANPSRVQLTWDAAADTQYSLEFAEARSKAQPGLVEASLTDYELVTPYAPVNGNALVPESSYPQGKAVVFHNAPEQKNYIYRLTPVVNGIAGTPSRQIVNSQLYSTVVYLTPYQITLSGDIAKSIRVNLNTSSTYFGDDRRYAITLYRREVSDPQSTFTQVTTATITDDNKTTWDYYDKTNVDIQKQYEYKVVASGYGSSAGTGSISSLRPAGYSGLFTGSSINTFYQTGGTTGGFSYPANAVIIPGNNLEGLSVQVLIKDSGNVTRVTGTDTINKLTNTAVSTNFAYYILAPANLSADTYSIAVTGPNGAATGNFTKTP